MANIDRTICLSRFIVITTLLLVFSAWRAQAQVDQGSGDGSRTLELVDHLKDLIRGAERDQRSNSWLTQQLRDLVRRYDWPWRARLFYDDFRDGNYTSNPRWIVSNGDFRITRDSALRSAFDPPAQVRRVSQHRNDPAIEILQGILWGGNGNDREESQTNSPSAAEIYTKVPISSAFAARLQFRFRNDPDSSTDWNLDPIRGMNATRDTGLPMSLERLQ